MRLPLAAVVVALVLAACGLDARESYDVTGVVESVMAEERQVRIAHDEIPGFMPAMTMNFDVASPAVLEGVEPGAQVRFTLERDATLLEITEMAVIGSNRAARGGGIETLEAEEEAPDFTLTAHDGEPFTLSELRGRAVLLDFIFTRCPGPCPLLTSAHVSLQRKLPEDVAAGTRLVSVSIDPEYDTPERLRVYAEERGADLSNWTFLTGDPEKVSTILRDYHVGTIRQPDGTLDHLVITFLIDREGKIARRYLGVKQSDEEILAHLEEVLG